MFDNVISLLAANKPEVSKAFFHYCRTDTLEKLLKDDAEIFCTHTAHLNDDMEILEGCRKFLSYLVDEAGYSPECVQMLERNLSANIHNFDPKITRTPTVMPWTFSLSEAYDSPYQWKHYTDCQCGGYCVAFDREKLENAINALNGANVNALLPRERRTILVLLPCLYLGVDDQLIQDIFKATISDFEDDFNVIKNSSLGLEPPRINGVRVLTAIFFVSSIIKRKRFRHEREWRIIMSATSDIRNRFETTVGKPCLRTLLSSANSGGIKDLIVQVLQSPQGIQQELTKHAQHVFKRTGALFPVHTSVVKNSVVRNYITRCVVPDGYEDYVVDSTSAKMDADVCSCEEFLLRAVTDGNGMSVA